MSLFGRSKKKSGLPDFEAQRRRMCRRDLEGRDIDDPRVLHGMGQVKREAFLPREKRGLAYEDHAVPIGHRQTISQPYIVALSIQMAAPQVTDRALDVGCGSGYAAAVLSHLVSRVTSIEIVSELAVAAKARLKSLGYDTIEVIESDASFGYADGAPYDVIISAAAPKVIPPELIAQLAPGGRLVIPVGDWSQRLIRVTKKLDGSIERHEGARVTFVPLTGALWTPPGDGG